jgi:predicted lipoprotein
MATNPRKIRLALAAAFICVVAKPVHAEADDAAIAQATLRNAIRPGYAALSASTDVLSRKTGALCAEPSAAALKDARDAFARVVKAWSQVEIFRFGPVAKDHRYERLFYWPDPNGIGLRQVQKAIAERDQSVTMPDMLAGKSAALQGLPALEYLLYGDDADRLVTGDADVGFRCSFAASIATNVDRIAHAVAEGWREGAAFTKIFLSPGPDDPLYHAPKDVTLELLKALASGIEIVRDEKLGKPLGATPEQAKPQLAPFWRSGLTLANLVGNLEGVRTLYAEGGLAHVVGGISQEAKTSILSDLDQGVEVLGAIHQPFDQVMQDDALRAKLEALRGTLKRALVTAGDMIARGAGLSFGFSAIDGD